MLLSQGPRAFSQGVREGCETYNRLQAVDFIGKPEHGLTYVTKAIPNADPKLVWKNRKARA